MGGDLRATIQSHIKDAMRARDKARLDTLRLISAAIKQREVDERTELDDAEVANVLQKMLKQRRDSLEQYTAAGRQDLADQESLEIGIIEEYMPTPLGDDELAGLIDAAIAESAAAAVKDMGRVMGLLKGRIESRADMGRVSGLVKQRLGG
ncbi:MAG: GatB/YqeY domain-containing protein [Gammaproteobacteria bacterium]|nr:GatB/YqeY domain-containing protein [Gammaproteobacteria bacterium]